MSMIGGVIGFIVGGIVIKYLKFRVHNVLLVGIYFAVFGVCVLAMCMLSEKIRPCLTGPKWQSKDWKTGLLFIPLAVVVMFGTGCFVQFIYGLSTTATAPLPIDDYVFLIDNSGSMHGNDPDELRISEIHKLVDELDSNKRVAYYSVSNTTVKEIDLQNVTDASKPYIHQAIDRKTSDGGTDLNLALQTALNDVKGKTVPGRNMAIVLLSDGEDSFDTAPVIADCNQNGIVIDCIGLGFGMFSSGRIMNDLANGTNGNFYEIQDADQLLGVFTNIKTHKGNTRLLLDRRYGAERKSALYGIERVIFIAVFGLLLGLALGAMFDNKQLFKNLLIGGAVTGTLAGLVMEIGLFAFMKPNFCRLLMCVLLSIVVSMFTGIKAYEITPPAAPPVDQFGGMGGFQGVPNQFGASNYTNNYNGPIGRF